MRVRENGEVEIRPAAEELLGVGGLGALRAVEHRFVARIVGQPARQLVCDPEPEIGVKHAEQSDRGGVPRDAVHELRTPVLLGEPVAVGQEGASPRELHLGLSRIETNSQVVDQEIAAPPVVVPADEGDRYPARSQGVQFGDRAEVTPGNDGAVLEPKVEQVSVDDERVSQIGDRVEEAVQRGADRRWDLSEMSVGDDENARGWGRHGPQARNAGQGPQAPVPFDFSRWRVDVASP